MQNEKKDLLGLLLVTAVASGVIAGGIVSAALPARPAPVYPVVPILDQIERDYSCLTPAVQRESAVSFSRTLSDLEKEVARLRGIVDGSLAGASAETVKEASK